MTGLRGRTARPIAALLMALGLIVQPLSMAAARGGEDDGIKIGSPPLFRGLC